MHRFILFKCILFSWLLCAAEPVLTPTQIHQRNQEIFDDIITKELADKDFNSARQQIRYLISIIGKLGSQSIEQGLDLSIYHYRSTRMGLAFNGVPLWKGAQQKQPLSLTFIIYIWPPETIAKQMNPKANLYTTSIHNHPGFCSFTILQGDLLQEMYQRYYPTSRFVYKIGEKKMSKGDQEIDLNEKPFIHRVLCKDEPTCISLHAYPYGSEKERTKETVFYVR
jgi:hypothetical protein